MSGLVERLRTHVTGFDDAILDEAAARIEALEAALREMADLVDVEGRRTINHCYSMARAALDKDAGK